MDLPYPAPEDGSILNYDPSHMSQTLSANRADTSSRGAFTASSSAITAISGDTDGKSIARLLEPVQMDRLCAVRPTRPWEDRSTEELSQPDVQRLRQKNLEYSRVILQSKEILQDLESKLHSGRGMHAISHSELEAWLEDVAHDVLRLQRGLERV
jgi:hypothetical protein